ncbi:prephenate dehydrogenase [Ruegeria sp. WL0004]|uniref:Prephenate dehydrogenase n=1 Tax=Ruegeria marisflavi TaxID=2984152 RepID=A0ABT2WWE0_9RHOB|nr:prephenate dehydrogenase [Ruegeria sp. WL0004]MCU9840037.1 prephenate dehydrogenase [Ruegeria sp. WL0004]
MSCHLTFSSIGLLGFGAFGRLIAAHLAPHLPCLVHDPALPQGATLPTGASATSFAEAASCDLVILAMPVTEMAAACRAIAPHLRPGTVVVDVGSVKLAPAAIMQAHLPEHVGLVGTHPLFGPQSARDGIVGRKIAICPIRGKVHLPVAAFLRARLGLQVIVTTPEAHDREAATVQGLTHLIAQALTRMGPLPSRMTTASFDLLMQATEMVRHDPPGVLAAIESANPFAAPVRAEFQALIAGLDRAYARPD